MVARSPADVDRLFGERSNAGDADGLVELYEAGATFMDPESGALVGHDSIRPYLAAWVEMKPSIDMGLARVVPLGDDLAMVHHDWHATVDDPKGERTEISGKATEIVRRQADGSWRFILDDPYMRN
jgi:uncharacterized protein (TIGR02246 family)